MQQRAWSKLCKGETVTLEPATTQDITSDTTAIETVADAVEAISTFDTADYEAPTPKESALFQLTLLEDITESFVMASQLKTKIDEIRHLLRY